MVLWWQSFGVCYGTGTGSGHLEYALVLCLW